MLRRLAGTLVRALFTAWLALTLVFVALRILPGDALEAQLVGTGASEAQIAERRAALGLDQPVGVQYLQMLGGLLRGDLGRSLISGRPVTDMIAEQFGATAALAAGALIVGVGVGLILGASAALAGARIVRLLAAGLIALLLSAPVYWTGTLAIYLFSVGLRWLPSGGDGADMRFLILPWGVLGLALAGSVARLAADGLRGVRAADFIRTARGKGLYPRLIMWRHMLRAAAGPLVALIALQTGFLLGGAVVTEMLFVRRGVGQVLLNAINTRDYPVVQGVVMLSAILYSAAQALGDMAAAALDPRLHYERS